MDEIVNRVANSKLTTLNLEDYYLEGERHQIDIKDWLYDNFFLKEKDFRGFVSNHNWAQYKDGYVALFCSTDAIIPTWAYMLVQTQLQPYARKVILGNLEQLETSLYQTIIDDLDVSEFEDKPVIIKGCSNKPVPPNAYIWATAKIQEVAKSVMFGEACSSVPLFKRK